VKLCARFVVKGARARLHCCSVQCKRQGVRVVQRCSALQCAQRAQRAMQKGVYLLSFIVSSATASSVYACCRVPWRMARPAIAA